MPPKPIDSFDLEELQGHTVIAGISGGKDSGAMSLWLTENGIEHERVFVDTGWEHPLTYAYIAGPLQDAIGPITTIQPPLGMAELIRKKQMFPSRVIRYCTQELKVFPLHRFFASRGGAIVNAIGIRAEESANRAGQPQWDGYADRKLTYKVWRPLLQWSLQDVVDIHTRHGLAPNPLYLQGAARVGCWPCIHARKAEIKQVAIADPERIDLIRLLESDLSERAGKPLTYFQRAGIDEVVEWSRTSHGGHQFDLFDTTDPDEGCVRWGLCGVPEPA